MTKTKEQQGYTVTEQDLLNDGTVVTTPAADLAPQAIPERPFTDPAPNLSTYDSAQQLYSRWAPTVLPQAEIDKRSRHSAQVQSIMDLGQAISAFQNMRGISKGAGVQKPVENKGTAPLKEWLKEQEAKRKESAQLSAEAHKSDLSEWKTDYQNWLAQKKQAEQYNDRVRQENIKLSNDYAKELRTRGYKAEDAERALDDWRTKAGIQHIYSMDERRVSAGNKGSGGSKSSTELTWQQKRSQMIKDARGDKEKERIGALDNKADVEAEWNAQHPSAGKKKLW